MERAKINTAFPNGLTGAGIFTALQSLDVPWKNEGIASSLDLEYHGNISGDKYVSPLINKLLDDDDTLTDMVVEQVAQTIYNLYNRNWTKLWSTFNLEYDPIQNYSMVEHLIDDERVTEYGKSHTRTDNLTSQRTDNLQHTKTGTESDDRDRTDNTENDLYGFNSSSPVHADKSDVTVADENTHTYNITDADTGTETRLDTGTQTEADTGSDTETRNYELTREGNIGVTTSQQMIQSERDLWIWDFFHTVVFPDVDRILTIQIY